jgi:hypothetical protein
LTLSWHVGLPQHHACSRNTQAVLKKLLFILGICCFVSGHSIFWPRLLQEPKRNDPAVDA